MKTTWRAAGLLCSCLAMASLPVGCEEEGGDGNVSRYAGSYSCSVAGDDSGTFTALVDNEGNLTASGWTEAVGDTSAAGTVQSNGEVAFGSATSGATFTGNIHDDGTVSGTWQNGEDSGTFNGNRQ